MEYALVVAAGVGSRMESALPKQFHELNGMPIVLHSLYAFFSYNPLITIVLILPKDYFDFWATLCYKYNFNKLIILQHGGSTRFQSVKNGLTKIKTEGLVAIHDAVRPLVSQEIITQSFCQAAIHQAAIAAVDSKDSLAKIEQQQVQPVNRSQYRLLQTPQTFLVSAIKRAYEIDDDPLLTDDASVAVRAGIPLTLFEGSYKNIKITTPIDMLLAEALLN